jgi:hypothetical protein
MNQLTYWVMSYTIHRIILIRFEEKILPSHRHIQHDENNKHQEINQGVFWHQLFCL